MECLKIYVAKEPYDILVSYYMQPYTCTTRTLNKKNPR